MSKPWKQILGGWLTLSRPPFHTVGILPFILGTVLAWKFTASFNPSVFILGISAVILIMLSSYLAGEYFDFREDEISHRLYRSHFAGGSGAIQQGILPRRAALRASIVSIFLAACIGLILQFYFQTGKFTLLLGFLGAFPGFFYSTKPIRLVDRGFGEIFIAFCYGWLPVASAYYIQTAAIHPVINWLAVPIGLTIFNVILLNEFPDYEADKTAGKRNLLNRAGKITGLVIYVILSLLASLAMFASVSFGVPLVAVYFYLPFFIISLFIILMMLRHKYEQRKFLEILCGLNIAVNLGTSLSYLMAYIVK
ncbi:MAG TPA: prenyltransferase [Smithellaceae bacterium]|nr:MAG: 1,4-dihydroxy-2-naphthoate octaprenyltransferase [Deltaproteobacteria bacterium ADurb.BinA014]HNZ31098.1 prenyltransferase [Smithellaceae bacterium]HOF78514.1 prenyltransferase [Smithellaceae bacterium]HOS10026.1 prenyltransferase [Smithellaceae bacterium]HPM70718.1 prenyltransferase [Smithellaceae bacterium]